MTKTNFNETRVCEGNVVHITQTFDVPKYTCRIYRDCESECDMTMDAIQSDCKIWCGGRNFTKLSNVEFKPTAGTLEDDLKAFQKMLDKNFGKDKYEAFVLGAYIHSGTCFSVNKTGNHVCQWDSSQLGFVGLANEPRETTEHNYIASEPDVLASDLNACWNGEFEDYQIIDEESGEIVDELIDYDYKRIQEFIKEAKEKYDVDFATQTVY